MSGSTTPTAATARWLGAEDLRAMGFTRARPEIDYGMRWGERSDIRVSFVPRGDGEDGFLYAYDRSADRYLLLAAHTTRGRVDAAWRELSAYIDSPDAYLALASLDERPLSVGEARGLLLHCLDRELTTYCGYVTGGSDGPTRFDAAFEVIVQRSARVSAERLLLDAARTASVDAQPAVVRYRLLGERSWSGRVAGVDLDAACAATKDVFDVAHRHQLTLQATSVSQGHATLSAARVPELSFAATRPALAVDAPAVGI
jgi:hypothetical protein